MPAAPRHFHSSNYAIFHTNIQFKKRLESENPNEPTLYFLKFKFVTMPEYKVLLI